MYYFLFDTETTGLYKRDEVIQFSGLLLDNDGRLIKIINEYCYTNVHINKEAEKTHKLNKRVLWELSGGLPLEKQLRKYDFLFKEKNIMFIGWNVGFDVRMVNQTLTNNGYEKFDFGKKVNNFATHSGRCYLDLMPGVCAFNKQYGSRMKLAKVPSILKTCTEAELNAKYNVLYEQYGKGYTMKYHNALFDSFVLWPTFLEYKDKLRM